MPILKMVYDKGYVIQRQLSIFEEAYTQLLDPRLISQGLAYEIRLDTFLPVNSFHG